MGERVGKRRQKEEAKIKTVITTIRDAERLISQWTERYDEEPTQEQIHNAARALVKFVGGYGGQYDPETMEFNLDEHLLEREG